MLDKLVDCSASLEVKQAIPSMLPRAVHRRYIYEKPWHGVNAFSKKFSLCGNHFVSRNTAYCCCLCSSRALHYDTSLAQVAPYADSASWQANSYRIPKCSLAVTDTNHSTDRPAATHAGTWEHKSFRGPWSRKTRWRAGVRACTECISPVSSPCGWRCTAPNMMRPSLRSF